MTRWLRCQSYSLLKIKCVPHGIHVDKRMWGFSNVGMLASSAMVVAIELLCN